jgi:2',3'-cyclic-nucleotide 2'-phosphodiesterase (5'-nucleotidase family)
MEENSHMPMTKRLLPLALLCASLASAQDNIRTVTILHSNDIHARLSPLENGNGGFAYLASVIRHEREDCTGCLLLNAGDVVQGSPVSTLFQGLPVFEIANLFGFDAGTLGNHDFDYGWQQTRKFMEVANYPIAVSNIVDGEGRLFARQPYVVLLANGVRVAVVGAMTDTLDALTKPQARGPWHTTSLVEAVRRYANEARGRADLTVVVAHITGNEEQALLALGPAVPVIVSGHEHQGLPQAKVKDGRMVVRAKAYGEEIGRLELRVNVTQKSVASWSWKKVGVDSKTVAPAPDVASQVKRWEDEVSHIVDQPLAVAEHEFSRAELKVLIERAMRDETGADFAFMNAGGVRDILPKGQLLVRHIWNVMPFDNEVVVGRFKGRDLPAVVTAGRAIDPDREYTLAVSDFTAANQNAPSQLQTAGLVFPPSGPPMRDMIVDWVRRQAILK